MKQYILWDMDGVLINSEPQHFRAWQRTIEKIYGVTGITWECFKPCIGAKFSTLVDVIKKNCGVDLDTPEVKARYEIDKLEVEKEEGFPEIPGARETLLMLHQAGFYMAIASSSYLSAVEHCVAMFGLPECFTLLFSGEGVKNSKPAPDTFLEAARLMNAPSEACVVVEDSYNGVTAAKAAGMYCIGYRNPDSGDQDLSQADVIITDLRDIPAILKKLD